MSSVFERWSLVYFLFFPGHYTFLGLLLPFSLEVSFFFFYIIFHSSHFRGPKGSVLLCLFFLFFLIQSRRLNSISQNPRPHITISNLFSTLDRSRLCSQLNYLKIRPLWFILTALIAIDFTKIKTRIFKVQGLYECLDQKLLTRALNNPTLSQGSHIRNPTN